MVLNKKEKVLMDTIVKSKLNKRGQVMLSPLQILQSIPYNIDFRADELEGVATQLVYDNYFTLEQASRKGELMYIITLKEKGLSYLREKRVARRNLIVKLAIGALVAALSFFVKWILGLFFN